MITVRGRRMLFALKASQRLHCFESYVLPLGHAIVETFAYGDLDIHFHLAVRL